MGGEDEAQGKVTVKPEGGYDDAPKAEAPKEPSPVKEPEVQPKKSFLSQKQKEEEQPAFAGFKLKKAETVKRQWDDGGLENVNLKHHEFEKEPQNEEPERDCNVLMSEALPD